MKKNQRWIVLSFLVLSLTAQSANADFGVAESTQSTEPYGNAETQSFHRAISGGTELTAQEEADLSAALPERDDQRYYARVRLNFTTLSLEELKNRSTGIDKAGAINKKRTTANQTGLEIALGYSWSSSFRGDIEYLVNKNLDYIASPVLTGGGGIQSRQLNVQIKNNTILGNLYYEFLGLNRFKPYLTAGIGPSVNSIQSTITPTTYDAGGSATLRKMSLAWSLGLGMRVAVFSHWHLDASYRYIRLGSGINIKPTGNFKLLSSMNMNALSLGLMYYF